ncbi:tetraspanin Pls1 family [Gymnopilus junonius]|uniref:Tetraspanin Pls1 family n=1 Tax=Gymnopilus junonius TaxID=109634 RepID=A0A9P5NBN0_GYMJU|nr:tetraspanin Pls1 family [Gymnopilus junonius]
MVSKRLMGVWAGLDILLLAAGALTLALSIVWRAPNVLMNMVISKADLTAGTVLGIAFIVTFAISVAAIVQRNHVTVGLVILNYTLLLDALGVFCIGTFIWMFTLHERDNFHKLWVEASSSTRLTIQDHFKCCGYFNGSDSAEVGGFCQSQDFINNLAANVTSNFCVTPLTGFADFTLNNIFTTIYGFMAIVLCLLLASLCVIKKRQEDERFKRIDAKRGGRGFV